MLSPLASSISVVSVSLFFGAALLVAWRRFGLKRYAAIWALSFLASAVGHGARVAGILLPAHQLLAAMLAVANKDASLIITGNGDVVEPEDGLIAMGSGGAYAQAAARALLNKTDLSAREIAETALNIAGDICVFTNHNLTIEEQDLAE